METSIVYSCVDINLKFREDPATPPRNGFPLLELFRETFCGLRALKQGLMDAPKLTHLHFSELENPLDCNNAH